MSYISFPISATPDEILESAYAYIRQRAPEWEENDGNLDTWILQSMAMEASDLRELALDVPDTIFRYFGELVGIPPTDASYASVSSTWTVKDNAGYTIPGGTHVTIRTDEGAQIPFQTFDAIVIPPGQTATPAGAVLLMAVNPGLDASGLGGNGIKATLVDVLSFVTDVTLTGVTSGGVDAETASEYNDRLTAELRLLANRPILPNDFSILAQRLPEVFRAITIDGGASGTYVERTVAVAAVDQLGNPVSSTVKADIDALLEANREVNFIVDVIDPTYTSIDVQTTVKALPSEDPIFLQNSIISALQQVFSPALWGRDPTSGDIDSWVPTNMVHYNSLIQLVSNQFGVAYVVDLQDRIAAGTFARTDITLPGAAALTRPGTMTVTVT